VGWLRGHHCLQIKEDTRSIACRLFSSYTTPMCRIEMGKRGRRDKIRNRDLGLRESFFQINQKRKWGLRATSSESGEEYTSFASRPRPQLSTSEKSGGPPDWLRPLRNSLSPSALLLEGNYQRTYTITPYASHRFCGTRVTEKSPKFAYDRTNSIQAIEDLTFALSTNKPSKNARLGNLALLM